MLIARINEVRLEHGFDLRELLKLVTVESLEFII
jgi:hypothetical protein